MAQHLDPSQSVFDPIPSLLFKLGTRFKELRALTEADNPYALLDAAQFAEDLGHEPEWLQHVKNKILRTTIRSQAHGGQWQKNLNKHQRAIMHFDRCRRQVRNTV